MDRRKFIGGSLVAGVALVVNNNLEGDEAVVVPRESIASNVLKLKPEDVIDVLAAGDPFDEMVDIRLLSRDWQQRVGAWIETDNVRVELEYRNGIKLVDAYVNQVTLEFDCITIRCFTS